MPRRDVEAHAPRDDSPRLPYGNGTVVLSFGDRQIGQSNNRWWSPTSILHSDVPLGFSPCEGGLQCTPEPCQAERPYLHCRLPPPVDIWPYFHGGVPATPGRRGLRPMPKYSERRMAELALREDIDKISWGASYSRWIAWRTAYPVPMIWSFSNEACDRHTRLFLPSLPNDYTTHAVPATITSVKCRTMTGVATCHHPRLMDGMLGFAVTSPPATRRTHGKA
nr:hypothetical protein CFP56_38988 [Quercus suber]